MGIFCFFKKRSATFAMRVLDHVKRNVFRKSYKTQRNLRDADFLFSKVISLHQDLLPKILFLSRIILSSPKQLKTLTSLLFKYLWNHFPFVPIKRSTLYRPKHNGGIVLPSIGLKTSTAFLWKIIRLQTPKPHHQFWMTYATYNLGTKIKPLKPELYSNSQPHRPNPNPLWKLMEKNP